ncbi:Extradiol ring-cleavage dioxygenase, class III enzyme, subunit B [Colletotrichum godetiae]|uniref:Extradiol ring-cleavage dioxygenase, class III enzyme, subunit B n=1 Tax=Colletotrichum godetiae TaxID=1209918 RepID=A0AAJ0AP40_9PEZI|nr:Extradiol ring-cleavage dioxygenase, class III enzyme, subunit B [Colletotrichum godetiae]KAK1676805.1 Extradiol ring-cleavage dioxygenase, class III enzyme, subunit B [Colletotrichum godetiae]
MAVPETQRAPSLFISHGAGPLPLIHPDLENFRQQVAKLGSRLDGVKGIILLSAHWESNEPEITALEDPGLYFDYGTVAAAQALVPPEAYETKYPILGNAALATEIKKRLLDCGFQPVLDYKRGLDHGVFVPLKIMRPNADIPVVQVSVLTGKNEEEATDKNLRLGRALEYFRDFGYAIMGSGGSYHDFLTIQDVFQGAGELPSGAEEFEDYLKSTAAISDASTREEALKRWRETPSSYVSHVKAEAEHFWPFLVAAGSGGDTAGQQILKLLSHGVPMSFYEW